MPPRACSASRPSSLYFTFVGQTVYLRPGGAVEHLATAYLCGVSVDGVAHLVAGATFVFPEGDWAAVVDVKLLSSGAVAISAAAAVPVRCPGIPAVENLRDAAGAPANEMMFVPITLVAGIVEGRALEVRRPRSDLPAGGGGARVPPRVSLSHPCALCVCAGAVDLRCGVQVRGGGAAHRSTGEARPLHGWRGCRATSGCSGGSSRRRRRRRRRRRCCRQGGGGGCAGGESGAPPRCCSSSSWWARPRCRRRGA